MSQVTTQSNAEVAVSPKRSEELVLPSNGDAKTVAVVDNFRFEIDADNDMLPDHITHGEVVASNLTSRGISVATYDLSDSHNPNLKNADFTAQALNQVIADISSGTSIDAVNLSLEFPERLKDLSSWSGIDDLSLQSLSSHREALKAALHSGRTKLSQKTQDEEQRLGSNSAVVENDLKELNFAIETIGLIEQLEKMGVDVYIAAGNKNGGEGVAGEVVNVLALAEGVTVVGALDAEGAVTEYTRDSSLVNRYELGDLRLSTTADGVDITGDGIADFAADRFSSETRTDITPDTKLSPKFLERYRISKGTSFATPRAIAKDLADKIEDEDLG